MGLEFEELRPSTLKEYKIKKATPEGVECVNYSLGLLRRGYSKERVLKGIDNTFPKLLDRSKYFYIALKFLQEQYFKDDRAVISTHLSRYDREIKRLRDFDYERVPPKSRTGVFIEKQLLILDVLRAKETLLQFHKTTNILRYNETNTNIKYEQNASFLDDRVKKMGLDDKVILSTLLDKMKGVEEVGEIKLTKVALIDKGEEVEVVTPEEGKNVDKMRERESKPVPVIGRVKGLTFEDIKRKIQENTEGKGSKSIEKGGEEIV